MLTPRFARRILLPAAFTAFFVGTLGAGARYYAGRPFDARTAVISDLQSPVDNPSGYGASAVGTLICALLLAPVVWVFFRTLRNSRPALALAGLMASGIGLTAALGIGVLAPFTFDYTPLHIQLAGTAFVGVSAGTWFSLLASGAPRWLLGFQFAALVAVAYLSFGPVEFDDDRLLTGLAFWEWVLCLDCAAALWALAWRVEQV